MKVALQPRPFPPTVIFLCLLLINVANFPNVYAQYSVPPAAPGAPAASTSSPNVITITSTSYETPTATIGAGVPNPSSPLANTSPKASGGGGVSNNNNIIIPAVVVGAVVVTAAIAIWIFRKWHLAPSRQFRNRQSMQGVDVFTPRPHHHTSEHPYRTYYQ